MGVEITMFVKWFDVSEEMPQETGTYFVTVTEENVDGSPVRYTLLAWFNASVRGLITEPAGWTLLNEFYPFSEQLRYKITHWMPLPTPPAFDEE